MTVTDETRGIRGRLLITTIKIPKGTLLGRLILYHWCLFLKVPGYLYPFTQRLSTEHLGAAV